MLALNVSTTTAPEVTAPPGGYFEAVTEATAPNSGYYEAVTEVTTSPGGYFEAVTETTAPPGGYYEAVTEVTTPPGGYYEAVTEVTVLPGGYYEAITETLIVFTLATTLVSSVVVCATPWVKRPISPTVRLSLSLAAANTLFAITWTLCLVGNMYLPMVKKVEVPECLKLSLEVMRLCSILIQILHLLVVALNHYIGIIRPLHYAATFTPTTLKAILAILWLTPLVGMFVVFSSVSQEGFQSTGCSRVTFYTQGLTFRVVWTCIFFGPTVVIIIVYCHIFHLLNNRSLYLVCPEQRSHLRRNIKTVRTTALIVGTFVVGWGPAVVKFVLICGECVFQEMDLHTQMYLGAGFNTLFSLKVFIDTFIYAIRLPDIRKALLTMWVIFRDRLKTRDPGLVDTSAVSSSRTGSTRLSYSSPSIHR
nr:trace amine-associated receptor 8-like [Procambarus clarkii]